MFAIATAAGCFFQWLAVPVPWLLGPMLAGTSYAIWQGGAQSLPPAFSLTGNVVIALATAARFSWDTLTLAASYALPLLGCILITGSLSLLNGYLLWRWAGIDRLASLLGCLPGASASIVALSEDMGADGLTVAILQYLRILMVTSLIPTTASNFFALDAVPQVAPVLSVETPVPFPFLLNLCFLSILGILGLWGGRQLKLPASLFLGPFLAGLLAFWLLPGRLQVPHPIFTTGMLFLGLSIGLKFDWQTVRQLLKGVAIEAVLVLILIGICLSVGYGFHLVTHIDSLTAVLGSTPGGISTMIASAMHLGADSGLVMAMQIVRMLLVLLLSPCLATFLVKQPVRTESRF